MKQYAIGVTFKQPAGWSKPYVYQSKVPYSKGDAVIAPTGPWWSIGKVEWCKIEYKFKEDKTYKHVFGEIKEFREKENVGDN